MSNKKRIRRSNIIRLAEAARDQDADYFDRNPSHWGYQRPATAEELKATDYPAGTIVLVRRLGANHRVRAFIVDAAGRN